jgi:hypothetical protein
MNLSRTISVIGSIACLAGLFIFHRESVRLKTVQSEEAELRNQLSGLSAELKAVRDLQASLTRDQVLSRQQATDLKQAMSPAPAENVGLNAQFQRQAARDRAKLGLQYLPLYQALHLTDQQATQVTALFADFMARRADILIAAQGQGLTRDDPAVDKMVLKEADDLKASITDILGPDGYQQWQNYRRTAPIYDFEQTLAANLYYSATPLSAAQAAQLAPQMAQLSSNFGSPRGPYDLDTMDPAKARAVASAFLSETQMSALDALASSQQVGRQQAALFEAWSKNPSGAAAPNP